MTQQNPRVLSVAIYRGATTAYSFKTLPGARCTLPAVNGKTFAAYADYKGVVRIAVSALQNATNSVFFQFTCERHDSIVEMVPIAYHVSSGRPPNLYHAASLPVVSAATIDAAIRHYGFDPRTASTEQLIANDLPLRPNTSPASPAYQAWLRVAISPVTAIVHDGGEPTGISHQFHQGTTRKSVSTFATRRAAVVNAYDDSEGWSGYEGNGGQGTFGLVSAEWNVPTLGFPSEEGQVYFSSMWVGIDGGYSAPPYPPQTPHVFQDGVEMDETWQANGVVATDYYIWREYFESSAVHANIGVQAADDVYCQVFKYISNNQVYGRFWCKNVTTGQIASIDEVVGNNMVNNTGEWILERPWNGSGYDNLSNYGTATMRNAWTQTTTGVWFTYSQIYPNWSLYQYYMTNSSDQMLSASNPDGTYNINFQWYKSF